MVGEQALAGVRVLEFSAGMAGPWVGRFMAYCGAEVIRVESHARPDVTRLYVSPREPEMGTQPECSPWFTDWNAGKRFVSLDLTKADAVDICGRLAGQTDIVVENYTAGVMDKLGLGYDDLRRAREDLIYFSTSGYGDSGPNSRYVTWGPNIEALSGMSALSGFEGRECTMTQYAYPDPLSALHGLFAVLTALDQRRRTGEGQYINLSQLEATASVIGAPLLETLANGREPAKLGNRALDAAPHGCYPCAGEDRWCAIAVRDEAEWRALCEVAGHDEWVDDARFATVDARLSNLDELDARMGEWTSGRQAHELMEALQSAGVPAGVVQTTEDHYRRDPQLAARGFFEAIPHFKRGTVVANGIALGLTATPGRTTHSGSSIGHDNDYVFRNLLGLTNEEYRRFKDSGAIE